MNPLTQIKNQQLATAHEIQRGLSESASWHAQYKHSAYIFVGGLAYELTEGDVLAVFAQYGEIVDVNLVRDKETGKSKGFAFVAYEDQRSTVLAVDNLSGAKVAGRVVRVQHVENYKKKRKEMEGSDGGEDDNDKDGVPPASQQPGGGQGERWSNDKYQERQQKPPGPPERNADPWAGPGSVFALLRGGATPVSNQPAAVSEDQKHKKEKKQKKDKKKKKPRHDDNDGSPPSSPANSPGPAANASAPRPGPTFGPPRPAAGPSNGQGQMGPPRSAFGPPRPGVRDEQSREHEREGGSVKRPRYDEPALGPGPARRHAGGYDAPEGHERVERHKHGGDNGHGGVGRGDLGEGDERGGGPELEHAYEQSGAPARQRDGRDGDRGLEYRRGPRPGRGGDYEHGGQRGGRDGDRGLEYRHGLGHGPGRGGDYEHGGQRGGRDGDRGLEHEHRAGTGRRGDDWHGGAAVRGRSGQPERGGDYGEHDQAPARARDGDYDDRGRAPARERGGDYDDRGRAPARARDGEDYDERGRVPARERGGGRADPKDDEERRGFLGREPSRRADPEYGAHGEEGLERPGGSRPGGQERSRSDDRHTRSGHRER